MPHFDVVISKWGMPPTCRAQQQEQSRGPLRLPQCTQNRIRLPVPWLPSDHSPSGAERRARTTAIAIVAAAQNGTSGALSDGKHAGRRAAWATPRATV